jgi:hypothetical protein
MLTYVDVVLLTVLTAGTILTVLTAGTILTQVTSSHLRLVPAVSTAEAIAPSSVYVTAILRVECNCDVVAKVHI